VISERRFASAHTAFWNTYTPLCGRYVRQLNSLCVRFAPAVPAGSDTARRALIAEVAFEYFCIQVSKGQVDQSEPLASDLELDMMLAQANMESRVEASGYALEMSPEERKESFEMARNLGGYFATEESSTLILKPKFRGCGILHQCEGDVAIGDALIEVKAISRGLGVAEVRQVLTYLALQYSSGVPAYSRISFVNPRKGVYSECETSELATQISGLSLYELLNEIVGYLSEWFPTSGNRQ